MPADPAYVAAVRKVLDESWKDVDQFIERHVPDVIMAERLRERIKNLIAAERVLMDREVKL